MAVAEELNFRKASERLHVAQPALSSQIQDLESELEVRLFDRNTGGVRLTAAGTAFLAETRLTLAQADKAASVARQAAAGLRGRVGIGYVGALAMDFMPEVFSIYRKKYPDVELEMIQTWGFLEQLSGLETGELSIAFAVRSADAFPKACQALVVVDSECRIALPKAHRLARKPSIRLSDLSQDTFLCFGGPKSDSPHAEIVKRIYASAGTQMGPMKMVDGLEALHASVVSGMGVTLLADLAGVERRPGLVMKKISDPGVDLMVQLRAFWLAGRESAALVNFIKALARVRRVSSPF